MSKQVVVSATVGPAKYTATFELTPEQEDAALRQGVLRVLQGRPSGQAEKALAYPGDLKRPEGFKRSDLTFGPEFEKAFTSAYEGAELDLAQEGEEKKMSKLNLVDISWEPYEGASAPEPKFARAKQTLGFYLFNEDKSVKTLKSGEPRTASSFAESRGIALPTEPWEEDSEFLKAVTDWLKEEDKKKASGD